MLARMSASLQRLATTRLTLLSLVVFVAFAVFVLPGQSSAMRQGAGSPDISLFYTPADLYRMAEAYGADGRSAYVRARWTFDLAFPIVYGAFLILGIGWLCRRVFAVGSRWQKANLAPLAAVVLDFLENSATSLVMLRYPAHTAIIDSLAPLFTFSKWVCVVASIVILLGALALCLRQSRPSARAV